MKERYIQNKKNKIVDPYRNSYSKMKIVDYTLKKYVHFTINRFSAKCSLLVNQIEEMKREFCTQLEGINECFSTKVVEKGSLPLVSPSRKMNYCAFDQLALKFENSNNYEQSSEILTINKSHHKNIKSHLINPDKDEDYHPKTSSRKNVNLDSKISLKLKGIKEIHETIPSQENINQIKANKIFETTNCNNSIKVSPKTKALLHIANSKYIIINSYSYLPYNDKMKIKYLNTNLHKEINIATLLSTSKQFLKDKLQDIYLNKNNDLVSQTSLSSLNFIKKENENDLKDMNNNLNRTFFKMIYLLSDQTIPNHLSYEHLYENVIRTNQAQSIKHLFLTVYLKKLIESPDEYSDNVINQYIAIIDEYPVLISQMELLNKHKSLSLFAFCLKEFYQIFLSEKQKRKEILQIETDLDKLKAYMKFHGLIESNEHQ